MTICPFCEKNEVDAVCDVCLSKTCHDCLQRLATYQMLCPVCSDEKPLRKPWWPQPQDWPVLSDYDGEPEALALLLLEGVLFPLPGGALAVDCSDTFGHACGDCEELPEDATKILRLYDMVRANPRWGATLWCCQQRKQRPIKEVEEMMRREGVE